jgi:hypothetical protein
VFEALELSFQGPLRREPQWGFLKGFARRALTYISVPLLLALFWVGLYLLSDAQFQQALENPTADTTRRTPYEAAETPKLDPGQVEVEFGLALVSGLVLCMTVRVMAMLYGVDVVWIVSSLVIVLLGVCVYMFFYERFFYRLLFDSVLRPRVPDALPWILFTGGVGGLLTEFALDRFPYVRYHFRD